MEEGDDVMSDVPRRPQFAPIIDIKTTKIDEKDAEESASQSDDYNSSVDSSELRRKEQERRDAIAEWRAERTRKRFMANE